MLYESLTNWLTHCTKNQTSEFKKWIGQSEKWINVFCAETFQTGLSIPWKQWTGSSSTSSRVSPSCSPQRKWIKKMFLRSTRYSLDDTVMFLTVFVHDTVKMFLFTPATEQQNQYNYRWDVLQRQHRVHSRQHGRGEAGREPACLGPTPKQLHLSA